PCERLATCQDVTFAAEAADALHDPRVLAKDLRFRELQLGFGRSVLQEILQLLARGRFHLLQVRARLSGQGDGKLPGDLVISITRGGAGSRLVLVNQALVEP